MPQNTLKPFILVVLLCALSGCSAITYNVHEVSKTQTDQAINATVPEDKALLYIIRKQKFKASGRGHYIELNGKAIGTLANATFIVKELPPGEHAVRAAKVAEKIWMYAYKLPAEKRPIIFKAKTYEDLMRRVDQIPTMNTEVLISPTRFYWHNDIHIGRSDEVQFIKLKAGQKHYLMTQEIMMNDAVDMQQISNKEGEALLKKSELSGDTNHPELWVLKRPPDL